MEPAKLGVVNLGEGGTTASVEVDRRVKRRLRVGCLLGLDVRHRYRGGLFGEKGSVRRKRKQETIQRAFYKRRAFALLPMCVLPLALSRGGRAGEVRGMRTDRPRSHETILAFRNRLASRNVQFLRYLLLMLAQGKQ